MHCKDSQTHKTNAKCTKVLANTTFGNQDKKKSNILQNKLTPTFQDQLHHKNHKIQYDYISKAFNPKLIKLLIYFILKERRNKSQLKREPVIHHR